MKILKQPTTCKIHTYIELAAPDKREIAEFFSCNKYFDQREELLPVMWISKFISVYGLCITSKPLHTACVRSLKGSTKVNYFFIFLDTAPGTLQLYAHK